MFDQSLFWPAFRAAGLLRLITATINSVDVDAWVSYRSPDQLRLDGQARSTEHEIEYQADDLDGLAKGDAITLWGDESKGSGVSFRVRERPFNDQPSADGYFQLALLTKI